MNLTVVTRRLLKSKIKKRPKLDSKETKTREKGARKEEKITIL
jgi:hypothetical protein